MSNKTKDDIDGFFLNVEVEEKSDCWCWRGYVDRNGYGLVKVKHSDGGRSNTTAHRFLWQAILGPLDRALELDHLCRNRACVNLEHLEPVTHAENVRRGSAATKTHCKWGHSLADAYRLKPPNGAVWRDCRTCNRICKRRYKERLKLREARA